MSSDPRTLSLRTLDRMALKTEKPNDVRHRRSNNPTFCRDPISEHRRFAPEADSRATRNSQLPAAPGAMSPDLSIERAKARFAAFPLPLMSNYKASSFDAPPKGNVEMTMLQEPIHQSSRSHGTFGERFWPLFFLGLLGVATLPLVLVPMLHAGELPKRLPKLPLPALAALLMINPVLYLAVCTALGAWLTPKLDLGSLVVARWRDNSPIWSRLRSVAPLAMAVGLALSAATLVLDKLFQPFLAPEWTRAAEKLPHPGDPGALLSGLLYGGTTEEIMLRWGVMSLFAWVAWRVVQKGKGSPSAVAMWVAIILAALVFAAGHLPAVKAIAPLDLALVLRTVTLNALAGVVFGWLFWRYYLEAAMVAHAGVHLGFSLLAWSGQA